MDFNKLKLIAKRKGACAYHMRLLESVHSYDDAVRMTTGKSLLESQYVTWVSFLVDHNIVPMSFVYARDAEREAIWDEEETTCAEHYKTYNLGIDSGTLSMNLAERLLDHKILRAQKARRAKIATIDAKFLADVRAHLEALPDHAFDTTAELASSLNAQRRADQ